MIQSIFQCFNFFQSSQANESLSGLNFEIASRNLSETTQNITISFKPTQPGYMTCHAAGNETKESTASGSVMIGDIVRPFKISGPFDRIADGDSVEIKCAVIVYNYSDKILWVKDGNIVENGTGVIVKKFNTTYSYHTTLTWTNITKTHGGNYHCLAHSRSNKTFKDDQFVTILVHPPEPPTIVSNFKNTIYKQSMGDSFLVTCKVSGLPNPSLVWYKNNEVFQIGEGKHSIDPDIVISPDNSTIEFKYLKVKDSGVYQCRAKNRITSNQEQFEQIVEGNFEFF